MLVVVMKDGGRREFNKDAYTDYVWRKEAFVVIRGNQWIAVFNWDCVKEVFCE